MNKTNLQRKYVKKKTEIRRQRNSSDTAGISSESDEETQSGLRGEADRFPVSTAKGNWTQGKKKKNRVYGTMTSGMTQAYGRRLSVENVTNPNSPSTNANSPAVLQKVGICKSIRTPII
jgi:hypothetical protein